MNLEGRLIVCLASSWDYDPTSKHHIMRILSHGNDVLWVNYHGTRRPGISRTDFRRGWSALRRAAAGLQRVGPTMHQFTPLVIPGASTTLTRKLHQKLLARQIARAIHAVRRSPAQPVQVWSFAPDVPYLVGQFGEECFVYYCVDEYSLFEDFDAEAIRNSENAMLDRADVVVTTSEALWERKRVRRPDAELVRHGVDYDHFARAWREPLGIPTDVQSLPRPIFGFFGLLHHWIDLELIESVAKSRPQYSFVLIGDARVDISSLKEISNVYVLGRRSYNELPAYCRAFDAGLLPFAQSAMTRHINPIKLLEYLAAGLPVVSTPLPEAERFSNDVTIAGDADTFAYACDRLGKEGNPDRPRRISAGISSQTWETRVDELSALVMGRVNRIPPQAARQPVNDEFSSAVPQPV